MEDSEKPHDKKQDPKSTLPSAFFIPEDPATKGKADQQIANQNEEPAERQVYISDPEVVKWTQVVGRWTAALVVVSALTCGVLFLQYRTLDRTDRTLKETLIAANRAWIFPSRMKLSGPLSAGQDADLLFSYGNSGREPAKDVGRHEDSKSIPMEALAGATLDTVTTKLRDAINNSQFPDSCAIAESTRYLGVIYPGTIGAYSNGISVNSKWVTEPIVKGYGFIVVKGCFVYETMREPHRSEYCFTYNTITDGLKTPEQRGLLSNCPTGNNAD